MKKKRVLSGIQPTGGLHLGNYLGAIKQWVERQDDRESFICIVDLHAITVWQEPEALRENTRQLAALLIAAGIDPERTTLFVQSHVRAHAEACWLFTCRRIYLFRSRPTPTPPGRPTSTWRRTFTSMSAQRPRSGGAA